MAYLHKIELRKHHHNLRPFEVELSPTSAERPFQHLIVTGPNGSGKSSLLAAIARELEQSIRQPSERPPATPDDDALVRLTWNRPDSDVRDQFRDHKAFLAYVTAQRTLAPTPVQGPSQLKLEQHATRESQVALSHHFLQFLVNRHTDKAYATVDNDEDTIARIERWFNDFEAHLRWLTDDPGLTLRYDRPTYNFIIRRGNGFEFDLHSLADGYASVLMIFAELILRAEVCQRQSGNLSGEPSGVVLIDEVETHLHLRLQEQILPFVTTLMPRVQFIVATHSPPVIASIDDATIYDLENYQVSHSSDNRGVSYGTLMTHRFHISSDMDIETTQKFNRACTLIEQTQRTEEQERELQGLVAHISAVSPQLALKLWYAREGIQPESEPADHT